MAASLLHQLQLLWKDFSQVFLAILRCVLAKCKNCHCNGIANMDFKNN
jgi:hypothetical protein